MERDMNITYKEGTKPKSRLSGQMAPHSYNKKCIVSKRWPFQLPLLQQTLETCKHIGPWLKLWMVYQSRDRYSNVNNIKVRIDANLTHYQYDKITLSYYKTNLEEKSPSVWSIKMLSLQQLLSLACVHILVRFVNNENWSNTRNWQAKGI